MLYYEDLCASDAERESAGAEGIRKMQRKVLGHRASGWSTQMLCEFNEECKDKAKEVVREYYQKEVNRLEGYCNKARGECTGYETLVKQRKSLDEA